MLHVEDGAVRLEPLAAAVKRAQEEEARRYVPDDVDLAAELAEGPSARGGR